MCLQLNSSRVPPSQHSSQKWFCHHFQPQRYVQTYIRTYIQPVSPPACLHCVCVYLCIAYVPIGNGYVYCDTLNVFLPCFYSFCLHACFPVFLSVCLVFCLSFCLSVCLSVCLSTRATLRPSWPHCSWCTRSSRSALSASWNPLSEVESQQRSPA